MRAGRRINRLFEGSEDSGPGWRTRGADDDAAIGIEHERRRGPPDTEAAYELEVVLGVDLEVDDARHHRRHVGQDPPRRAARCAEGAGELEQGGALPQRTRQVVNGSGLALGAGCSRCGCLGLGGVDSPTEVTVRAPPRHAQAGRHEQGDQEDQYVQKHRARLPIGEARAGH